MSDWWIDGIIVLLLLLLGVLAVSLRKLEAQANVSEHFESSLEKPDKPGFSFYPRKLIRQSGFSVERARWVYWPLKLAMAIIMPMILVELSRGAVGVGWLLGASSAGFFAPDAYLWLLRRTRKKRIAGSLSLFVSLIVVYLRSGLSLRDSFDHAARFGLTDTNPLAKEVLLLSSEISAGRSREEAFTCLAERTGVDELMQLASVLEVGFSVGSPMAQTLEAQADLLVARQRQRGTQLANRKTMEAMLPMIMVCFPMFLVLVFYPAGAQVFEVMTLLKELF